MRTHLIISAALITSVLAQGGESFLVRDGKSTSAIVLESWRTDGAERYAAEELQRWIGEITGAHVPLRERETVAAETKTRVFVGVEPARKSKLFNDDFRKIGRTDGFAVRTVVTNDCADIYIFGSQPRGTLHGIYAFLEKNSDIIWARPDPTVGTVFGTTSDFPVKDADFVDVPKSATRSWQWTWHSPKYETEWSSRNRLNRVGEIGGRYDPQFRKDGIGHGIQHWIDRNVYFEKHPEWYPADKSGKRHANTGQICFTTYDMIPTYISNIVAYLDVKYTGKRRDQVVIDYFNVSCADNWDVCHCEKCEQPFVCENGVVVDPTNEVFRSAQHYTFLNKAARELKKTYPNVSLATYAYEFTLLPPPFPLDKNVFVEYCPYGLNEKAPVTDEDSNAFWLRCWKEWGAFSQKTWCRYYLGWANEFPRQIEGAIAENGRFNLTLRHPIMHWSAEHPIDSESKVCPNAVSTWDSSAISAWCINRIWWDPTLDVDTLRSEFCRRTFREAAEPMKAFYDTIRDSVYSDKLPSLYTATDPIPYTIQYIIRPGLTDKLRGYLADALAKAKHPVSHELIRRQLAHFDSWVDKAKNTKFLSMDVPYSTEADIAKSFEAPFWDKLEGTGDLVIANEGENHGKQAKFRSTAKIVHDRENLFIRFDCYAPDMATLQANKPTGDAVEQVPRGDIMEFYLGDGQTGVYYQFMLDVGNGGDRAGDVIYDGKVFDNTWNGTWTRETKRYNDKWTTIVRMPLADLGLNAVQTGKILFQAIRGKYYDSGRKNAKGEPVLIREMSSWGGGWVHQPQTFGELKLQLN